MRWDGGDKCVRDNKDQPLIRKHINMAIVVDCHIDECYIMRLH